MNVNYFRVKINKANYDNALVFVRQLNFPSNFEFFENIYNIAFFFMYFCLIL